MLFVSSGDGSIGESCGVAIGDDTGAGCCHPMLLSKKLSIDTPTRFSTELLSISIVIQLVLVIFPTLSQNIKSNDSGDSALLAFLSTIPVVNSSLSLVIQSMMAWLSWGVFHTDGRRFQ